jgi:hypothetical protein
MRFLFQHLLFVVVIFIHDLDGIERFGFISPVGREDFISNEGDDGSACYDATNDALVDHSNDFRSSVNHLRNDNI